MNFNLDSEKFKSLLADTNSVILDVRTEREHNEKRIPNSILIDFYSENFAEKIFNLDKAKKYLVYCRSGSRSFQTCVFMQQIGFTKVFNLKNGLLDWEGEIESDFK